MGPKGSKTPLHYDTDFFNLLCITKGEKEIFLIEPYYDKYMYKCDNKVFGSVWSNIDIWNIDYKKFPLFNNVKYHKIILKEGDILYIHLIGGMR